MNYIYTNIGSFLHVWQSKRCWSHRGNNQKILIQNQIFNNTVLCMSVCTNWEAILQALKGLQNVLKRQKAESYSNLKIII